MTNDDWRTGFHRALIDAIFRNGSPHDPARSAYWGSSLPDNWTDVVARINEVGIDYTNTPAPIEANWTEFGGSFDEDERKYGVDVELFLLDGTRTWYRYDGTISQLILAVVTIDDDCPGSGQRWTTTGGGGNRICPTCHTTRRALTQITGRATSAYQVPNHPRRQP